MAEFKKHSENLTFGLESKIEASASKIEDLENNIAASERALKELSESASVQISAAELERSQLQDQVNKNEKQVAACYCCIIENR